MLKSLFYLCLGILSLNLTLLEATYPYSSVHPIPATPYFVAEGSVISSLIVDLGLTTVIDVGSKDGMISRFVAQQGIQNVQQIYSIDLWLSPDPFLKYQYQQFLSNVINEDTVDSIVTIRMSSREASRGLNLVADFIYLGTTDSSKLHEDIANWISHLSTNGIIAGGNWYDSSIKTAVSKSATEHNLNISVNGNLWYVSRN